MDSEVRAQPHTPAPLTSCLTFHFVSCVGASTWTLDGLDPGKLLCLCPFITAITHSLLEPSYRAETALIRVEQEPSKALIIHCFERCCLQITNDVCPSVAVPADGV